MPQGIRHQTGEWWNPANLPRDKVLGAVALVLVSALCYFGLGLMGPQGLFLMTGGLLAAIITVYLLLKYPIVITLVWFLSMSGLHTLVMIRMPGLPDFSFPRLFFVMILFLIPIGIIRGRSFMHPPYSPDIFMVLFTFYVFFNMNTIGKAEEFNLWLISCFTPMVAYFFAKQYIRTHNQIAILMTGFILVTIYFWIVSVGDHFEIESMVWPKKILDRSVGKSWFGRSRGPFLQPALFGQIFGMYLLVHLFVLTRKISNFWKVLITLNIIAGGFGLLYTYTRGGWLATAAGVVVLAILRPGFRKIVITAAIIGVIFGASGVFKTGNDEFLEKRMANTGTVENRLGFLANASRMIADNPLFGVGYFRFTELRHLYNQGTEIPFYGYVKREASAEVSIHDIYIGRAAEEGLVGLFLFLGFYVAMFREYIARWKENPKGSWFDRDTIALMGAMTAAYLVGGMVIDYRYFDLINILPCFMAGVIVGFPDRLPREKKASPRPPDMSGTLVFFRNDDVNRMEPGLVETTDLLNDLGIPISHAVEPANLEPDTRDWLLQRASGGVEIIQHGYAHTKHDVGEFGGMRSAADQEKDLRDGLRIMEESFGDAFFKAMSFPFGSYNEHSIPLLESLGYPVVSCHWRHQFSRQVYYRLGRLLRRGRWLNRHVSHHLKDYPGTGVREISVTIAPIARYLENEGPTACVFREQDVLQDSFRVCRGISDVVGVVLHHRYRVGDQALQHLDDFARWLKNQPEVTFATMEEIHKITPRTGG